MAEAQILIAAYGREALEKIAALRHDEYPGVEYIVGWQNYDKERIPDSLSLRSDFKIITEDSTGLCNNRNALLKHASAPIAVISDDDLEYTTAHLANIFRGIKENPDSHLLAFRYDSPEYPKSYPPESFDLSSPPKNYFVTSMEMVFNLYKIKGDFGNADAIWFHPAFGVNGTMFCCGEEDLLIGRLLRKGFRGKYVPLNICLNTESTTSERMETSPKFIETKGAVISYLHPVSAFLRMLTHARRACKAPDNHRVSFLQYCQWWRTGVVKAKRNKVFIDY